jgi:hypothetical protein
MKLEVVSADELERKNEVKREFKKEVLVRILNMLCKKISFAYSLGKTDTLVQIPEMIFGYPSYNLPFVTVYMNKQLQNLGYSTSIMGLGLINISWKVHKVKNIELGFKKKKRVPEEDSDLKSLANLKKTAEQIRKKYISK